MPSGTNRLIFCQPVLTLHTRGHKKNGSLQCLSPKGASQLVLSSLVDASRSVIESLLSMIYVLFHLMGFLLVFRLSESAGMSFKSEFSIPCSSIVFLNMFPIDFQIQRYLGRGTHFSYTEFRGSAAPACPLHIFREIKKLDGASLVAQLVKNLPAMQETLVQFLGREDPLEKERLPTPVFLGFPCGSAGKESTCNMGGSGFDNWVRKIPWRMERLLTPELWPRELRVTKSRK